MTFFDEIGRRMSGVAQSAQKTAEIARLQRQINSEKNEFSVLFSEIGKLYYNCRQSGTMPGEPMDHLCDRVDALAQNIEQMNKKLDNLKQIRRCPVCGSVQGNDNHFCSNCGAKLEVESPAEPEAAPEAAPAAEAPAEEAKEAAGACEEAPAEEAKEAVEACEEAPAEEAKEAAEACEEAPCEEKCAETPEEDEAPAEAEEPEEESKEDDSEEEESEAEDSKAEEEHPEE